MYKRYNQAKDPYDFYRVMLLLYLPWGAGLRKSMVTIETVEYDEIELKITDDDPLPTFVKFETYREVIAKNRTEYEQEDFENILQAQKKMDAEIQKQRAADAEKEASKKNNAINRQLGGHDNQTSQDYDPNRLGGNTQRSEDIIDEYGFFEPNFVESRNVYINEDRSNEIGYPKRISNNDYYKLMQNLNKNQHIYIMNFITRFKNEEPFKHFINGKAGTGKSFLLRAIYQTFIRFFQPEPQLGPDELLNHQDLRIHCVIGCYTGKAAFNVRGDTLHHLWGFDRFGSNCNKDIPLNTLNKLRKRYKNLRLVAVDEISMVSADFAHGIDQRCRKIFDKPNIPYAGIPQIIVGDFNQLAPIGLGGFFWNNPFKGKKIANCVNHNLWELYEYFELTEIQRQDKSEVEFINALNKIGDDGVLALSDKEVKLLNSRIVNNINQIPKGTVFLFFGNKMVDEFNQEAISKRPGTTTLLKSIDSASGRDSENQFALNEIKKARDYPLKKTNGLKPVISVKVGIPYMIIHNLNVMDGLVNGTVGILRNIVFKQLHSGIPTSKIMDIKRMWFEFDDKDIGFEQRSDPQFAEAFLSDRMYDDSSCMVNPNWVPIGPVESSIDSEHPDTLRYNLSRLQYAIVEALALTIHKSQGQSYRSVALCIYDKNSFYNKSLKRAEMYVGLTRVTSINGLYLFGDVSILKNEHRNKSEAERKQILQSRKEMDDDDKSVKKQMALARSRPMLNRFPFLTNEYQGALNKYELSIMFHNIRGFRNHKREAMISDRGFSQCDIIHLVSAGLVSDINENGRKLDDKYKKMLECRTSRPNSQNGQLNFCKRYKSHRLELIYVWALHNPGEEHFNFDKVDGLEFCIFKYWFCREKNAVIYLVFLYKHPNYKGKSFPQFLEALQKFFYDAEIHNLRNVIIVGDFNVDFNIETSNLEIFKQTFGVEPLFKNDDHKHNTCTILRKDKIINSHIDWAFSGIMNSNYQQFVKVEAYPYESWFSDHKPIYIKITCDRNIPDMP